VGEEWINLAHMGKNVGLLYTWWWTLDYQKN